jgi:hypothetical protein
MSKLINPDAYNNPYLKQFFISSTVPMDINSKPKFMYSTEHIDVNLGEDKLGFYLIYYSKKDVSSWLERKSYCPNNMEIIVRGSYVHRSLIYYAKKYFNITVNICDLYDDPRNYKKIMTGSKCKWVMLVSSESKKLKISQYAICPKCKDSEYAFIVHDNSPYDKKILCPICNDESHIRYFCINCKDTFKGVKNQIKFTQGDL